MPKVIVNLTDTQIRSAVNSHKKLSAKVQIKLSDGNGLFFIIDKNGNAYWRWDYTRPITKKRNSISLGTHPEISLSSARAKRADCRELLAQNIDPAIQKQREDELTQFRNNFVWDKLYATIGAKTITDITTTQILDVCRLYERQGKTDPAK